MGRARKELKYRLEGQQYVLRFLNPLTGKARRLVIGRDSTTADKALAWLNRIFADASAWRNKPVDVPDDIWKLWTGGITETIGNPEIDNAVRDAIIAQLESQLLQKERRIKALEEEIVFWKGKRTRNGPSPTLAQALASFVAEYKGRDRDHIKIVQQHLTRFVKHFGEDTDVDSFVGGEKKLATWLAGLVNENGPRDEKGNLVNPRAVSAGYKNQVRDRVLMFLDASGVHINRELIPRKSRSQVRAGRGPIRWLEREQAEALGEALPEYWDDVWRVQVGLGLRPTEVITLKRSDFNSDYSECILQELDHHTLKTGSRRLQVSDGVREIVKRRLMSHPLVFPQLFEKEDAEAQPWRSERWFCSQYRKYLRQGVRDVNDAISYGLGEEGEGLTIRIRLDARTGRRTSGSLLLRAGASTEAVGAFLGDDPKTIREHYAQIISHELDPKAAAV